MPSISALRKTDPSRLPRGDLDWISMRALEKDRTRRYPTPGDLARDILRHLEGDAVAAGPPSSTHRLGRFARKHRSAIAVAGSFALLLVAATIVSVRLAVWPLREKNRADAARGERPAGRHRGEHARRDRGDPTLRRGRPRQPQVEGRPEAGASARAPPQVASGRLPGPTRPAPSRSSDDARVAPPGRPGPLRERAARRRVRQQGRRPRHEQAASLLTSLARRARPDADLLAELAFDQERTCFGLDRLGRTDEAVRLCERSLDEQVALGRGVASAPASEDRLARIRMDLGGRVPDLQPGDRRIEGVFRGGPIPEGPEPIPDAERAADRSMFTPSARFYDGESPAEMEIIVPYLRPCRSDGGLVDVRDEASLAALPAAEREEFRKSWADLDRLMARAFWRSLREFARPALGPWAGGPGSGSPRPAATRP